VAIAPDEDLAKSGYQSHMKYKSLIILSYYWLPYKPNLGNLAFLIIRIFSLLATENFQNHFIFKKKN
jgi:hypothetical protein